MAQNFEYFYHLLCKEYFPIRGLTFCGTKSTLKEFWIRGLDFYGFGYITSVYLFSVCSDCACLIQTRWVKHLRCRLLQNIRGSASCQLGRGGDLLNRHSAPRWSSCAPVCTVFCSIVHPLNWFCFVYRKLPGTVWFQSACWPSEELRGPLRYQPEPGGGRKGALEPQQDDPTT